MYIYILIIISLAPGYTHGRFYVTVAYTFLINELHINIGYTFDIFSFLFVYFGHFVFQLFTSLNDHKCTQMYFDTFARYLKNVIPDVRVVPLRDCT